VEDGGGGGAVTPAQFARYLDRDSHCLHCGTLEGLVPQHRAGRGMGGSKAANKPSNIIALCALYNGLIESDAERASEARLYGWKLSRWADSLIEPVYDAYTGVWWLLDDHYGRVATDPSKTQS
jgi:hypothetical protein